MLRGLAGVQGECPGELNLSRSVVHDLDLDTARTTYFVLNLAGLAFDFLVLAGAFDGSEADGVAIQFGLTPDWTNPYCSVSVAF